MNLDIWLGSWAVLSYHVFAMARSEGAYKYRGSGHSGRRVSEKCQPLQIIDFQVWKVPAVAKYRYLILTLGTVGQYELSISSSLKAVGRCELTTFHSGNCWSVIIIGFQCRRPRWLGRWSACLPIPISWVQVSPSACS